MLEAFTRVVFEVDWPMRARLVARVLDGSGSGASPADAITVFEVIVSSK